jgi:hypothetical protein
MDLLARFEEAGHNGHGLRLTTFWSWNDRLDPEEVRRQIREMAKAGLGGYFMHARRGLETPYLGSEWLEAVRAAIDEARHTDVTPWLYDEDCWLSGTCSGRVFEGNDEFQSKHLVCDEITSDAWEPSERTVAVFLARRVDGEEPTYRDFELLADPRSAFAVELSDDRVLLQFAYRTEPYVDTLNREGTSDFLRRTHEVYRDAVGRDFGRLIPGIFTDEPMYGRKGRRVPWSLGLRRFFERSTGYDLLPRLPELFFPVGSYRRTRFDFYESLTRLFLLAWTMPVYQWCDRHELALTGHVMSEDTLLGQVVHVGAAMPHYEYMHLPGIDHLGRRLGSPVLVKQAASVAAQLGRSRVLSEMFGCAGWNASFDDLRWIAEWQFALGVSLACQHLSGFTLRGERKRDFPPSLHYHQPWWPDYYVFNDYVARLLAVLTAGRPVVDVLVVHPISSAWAEFSPLDTAAVEKLDERLRRLAEVLLGMHADFHFGDELILDRHARVEKGELVVGSCRYGTVVVPDATNLRRSTLNLLRRLKRSGGRIMFAGRVPANVDGQESDEVADLAEGCRRIDPAKRAGRTELRDALSPPLEVRTIRGRDAEAVLAQWREIGDDHAFFFLNTAADGVKTEVRLPVEGRLIRLDPNTGRSREIEAETGGGGLTFDHAFEPRGSALFLVRPEDAEIDLWSLPEETPTRRKVLSGRWRIERRDPNTLVLDVARYRLDDGEYGEPMSVMDIQQTLLRNHAHELVCLQFEFDCRLKDLKGRRFELVLEQPEEFELWYGGMRTPLTDAGPYWDSALRRVNVTPFVRRGRNVVELGRAWQVSRERRAALLGLASTWRSRTVTPETELEPVYLTGDFGVEFPDGTEQGSRGSRWMRGRPVLVDEPQRTSGRDLLRYGYPFFAGRMRLVKDVRLEGTPSPDAVLELPDFDAITATVEINGREAGTVWKSPRVVPVGELLQEGLNRVAITLATSLRNLLGPHHHADGELHGVSPSSFAGEMGRFGRTAAVNEAYRSDYNVVNFGLGGDPVLRY